MREGVGVDVGAVAGRLQLGNPSRRWTSADMASRSRHACQPRTTGPSTSCTRQRLGCVLATMKASHPAANSSRRDE